MNKDFYKHIFDKHQDIEAVPSNKEIATWALGLIRLLFPEQSKRLFHSVKEIEDELESSEVQLRKIMDSTGACHNCDNKEKAAKFFNDIPELYRLLNTDVAAILDGDPAAKSEFEVIRAYPGFYAISFYRVANALFLLEIPLLPRILTEYAHSKTGIDIHPGAQISEYLYIDHGTGIVIGETAQIGHHVKLYQGVTLGALSVEKSMASVKRHPTVGDHVVIYSGATILGGDTEIGSHSIIGGNVWLTKSVPAGSVVYHESQIKVLERKF
ncbi:serine O-acetyltransferase [Arcticibacter tournemirensis]|uniref:Serine acetyltransferase n=1 Tax=Arcticibacter tournemirensis TaxID=699437 RepID=A0A5M9H6I1_9SPHI|nr:serine O-acetyltransferase EpsC [Arcticibacter tournemirensis]KAA8481879.1 serine acetyltransferase [Arcticibacter tournemirensis]TQM52209.1 serine O-acetyltransferase [Arcticibacter tournemirensis]